MEASRPRGRGREQQRKLLLSAAGSSMLLLVFGEPPLRA